MQIQKKFRRFGFPNSGALKKFRRFEKIQFVSILHYYLLHALCSFGIHFPAWFGSDGFKNVAKQVAACFFLGIFDQPWILECHIPIAYPPCPQINRINPVYSVVEIKSSTVCEGNMDTFAA